MKSTGKRTKRIRRSALNNGCIYPCILMAMILVSVGSTTSAFLMPAVTENFRIRRRRGGGALHVTSKDAGESSSAARRRAAYPRKTASSNRPSTQNKQQKRNYSNNNNNNSAIAVAIATNKKLIECETPLEVLTLLASIPDAMTKPAAGQKLNSVNFSTALHRIARHLSYSQDERARILSDPRFALFLCALSEALVGQTDTKNATTDLSSNSMTFNSRECSNIAWALAKLRLVPPSSTLEVNLEESVLSELVEASFRVRKLVLEAARNRGKQQQTNKQWIPALSLLAGKLLDSIAVSILNSKTVFNPQEMANLLWAFSTTKRGDIRVFDHIAARLVDNGSEHSPKPQELSNSIWAFASAQIHGEGESNLIRHVAYLLDERPEFVNEFKAQELSNTAWGIATIISHKRSSSANNYSSEELQEEDRVVLRILRHVARAIAERTDEFKSQEISNTAWAFATLGFGMSESESTASVLNDYIFLQTDDMAGDQRLMSDALDAVAETALPMLNKFRSQELNNLAWAYARLERKESTKLYEGIGREFGRPRRHLTGQDVGTTLWAFATLDYFDEDIYRLIASRLTIDQANQFKPQELSNSVWALATAGVIPRYLDAFETSLIPPKKRLSLSDISDDPVTLCFAAAAKELMRRPQQFKSQEIKDVMWSFSKVGVRHPLLFKTVAEYLVGPEDEPVPKGRIHCGRGLDDFSPQGLGNLSWSYAKQAQLACEAADRIASYFSEKTGRLAVYSSICVDIGETLLRRLFNSIAEADLRNHDGLSRLKPQDMSNTIWAFAVLGLRHGPFVDAVSGQLVRRLSLKDRKSSFKGQELANILWACAGLNHHDLSRMLAAATSYMVQMCTQNGSVRAEKISKHFRRQELANIVYSCAVAGYYDADLLNLLYTGLVGRDDECDPEYLRLLYDDGGLQRQAIMSLLHLQLAVDLEDPNSDMTLPENFPDGWNLVGESGETEDMMEMLSSMLTLSTSKIQKDVSSALKRIGFEHVQEHVISMRELVQNHGVQLSSQPLEILSIDVANIDRKIGVEVDGPAHFISVLDDWSAQEPARGSVSIVNGKLEYQFKWDDRQQMNGSTALKERLLGRLGWTVLHVPFWQWYAVYGDSAREEEYCRELLKDLS